MTKNIIGIAGRKEAGKDSATRFIYGQMMMKGQVIDSFQIGEGGELFVPIVKEKETDEEMYGEFKIDPYIDQNLELYLAQFVWPFVKKMAFADSLKVFCMDYLNISPLLLWGTNKDKETLTEYKKSQLPLFTCKDILFSTSEETNYVFEDEEFLTVRELLQLVGTELFRKIDNDYWVKLNMRLISNEPSKTIIVPDLRFPNEIKALKNSNAYLIYLTRNIHENKDGHSSENSLNDVDLNEFDLVIDNKNKTLEETHEILEKFLVDKEIL